MESSVVSSFVSIIIKENVKGSALCQKTVIKEIGGIEVGAKIR